MELNQFRRSADEKLSGKWGEAAIGYFIFSLVVGFITSIGGVGMLILGGPLMFGYALFIDEIYRGERPNINTLFKGFSDRLTDLILLGLLSQVYLMLWSLLFIIPGIIKSYSYSMIYYIKLDNPDMHYEDVITRSRKIMDGNKWRLFCLYLSHIGWYFLVFLTGGILIFWVEPKVQLAKYAFYQEIKHNYHQ
ncbi:MAG: DUF975 family protein [Bacilli bacterium]|jgi:uncharacterized membrane protein